MTALPAVSRLGVFGGAFDPPHKAHVALAQAAVDQLNLDQLRVFPTGHAWHKTRALTNTEHRLALARIAFGDLPRTVIDDRELRRAGATYTIDTLRELAVQFPGAQLFLVMGEDQAVALTSWREWEAIVQLAVICVAGRAQAETGQPDEEGGVGWPAQAQVRRLKLPEMPESATEIRSRVAQHVGIAHLVPSGVASYIAFHSLYEDL